MRKTLISVVGPTAVGKTAMAIQLATYFNTEIVSADSRQFYRELNIGTAKPDLEELDQVPHHFINSHPVETIYSAGDFERDALSVVHALFQKHDVVVLVGGSGLFVRALTEGLDDLPQAPASIRERLNAALMEEGLSSLQERLKEIDPVHYAQMDFQNPQRVVRALEVYETTGKSIAEYQQRKQAVRTFDVITIGLNREREALYNRINQRVDNMMASGLLDEVQSLSSYRHHPALRTVGYVEIFDFLDGKCTREEAVEKIKQNSRRYAKRQITWFKKYGNTHWFDPTEFRKIQRFLHDSGIATPQNS
ncbi:tRNA (adenosine(37)-N6)-dimethylallyltransferase MiaA [Sphingobacterium sp. lm-10]|uniref:tRNA (adenosine(37)-N6)-dimethylallyltransferase MiaA n=1 Tax=Sphingobacterium sp. lm-10 TaxID=2944904 RepID=UPI0020205B1A|nr:tRNA (adenosine(37)-N6)-dimethylallyltransferase MiaA [Sphingobacterium sp. lm-10]MCL7988181.1 tRNA (adenosine(37)-N6)-dimethylallyltransferase MiaA [Sphingobacterium sp. lm-10]